MDVLISIHQIQVEMYFLMQMRMESLMKMMFVLQLLKLGTNLMTKMDVQIKFQVKQENFMTLIKME